MTTQTYDAASLRGRLHVSTKSFVIWALVGEDAPFGFNSIIVAWL